jgi:hypothetical protein
MYSLTYVSSATSLLSRDELRGLLIASRANNDRAGVTGMLLYKGGHFMQVLEGERRAVQAAQAKILSDPRHNSLVVLLQGEVPGRSFKKWPMAFRDLDEPSSRNTPGYDDFLNTPLTDPCFMQDPAASQKLLQAFRNM